jgi:hypothetical protein
MAFQHRAIGLLAGAVLLAGCAATTAAQTPRMSAPPHAGSAMTPGMIMPDGSTMGVTPGLITRGPSAAARMICQAETRNTITKALALEVAPASRSRWADATYTCTYRLAQGPFVLSVKEATSPAAAARYLQTRRGRVHHAARLDGLTPNAYGTPNGIVMLRKDNDVLTVDAGKLRRIVGNQHARRADFAYQIATDILGCWTGG